jgi:hypothetical protein
MTEFTNENKKIVHIITLQKEFEDDVVRKMLSDLNREATKSAKVKKTYIVIFADK